MRNGGESMRYRGVVLALTLLVMAGLIGEATAPAIGEAKPKRDRGVDAEVFGGTVVPQGKYPFMVLIMFEGGFICGGTLIEPSFVLTAAHCVVDDLGDPADEDDFELVIGDADVGDFDESHVRGVTAVTVHSGYDPFTAENDVALLELDEAVPASIASPLAIVRSGQTSLDNAGREAVVAGWGETEEGESSDLLLEAPLKLVSNNACGAVWGGEFHANVMICASLPARDACFGDSGGPLIVHEQSGPMKKKRKKGKHKKHKKRKTSSAIVRDVQSGIVSFGPGEPCAEPGVPGVYTRLSAPGINEFIVDVVHAR